jgi:hypothetical protein
MKLAEALILRADYQKRLEQLKQRALRNAKVQEGDAPAENPDAIVAEADRVADDLERLIKQINTTNSRTEMGADGTLSDAIATRDVLRLRQAIYRELASAATVSQARTTRSEVRFVSAINVAEVQQRADDFAREHRELDARIQEANWRTDLIE